MIRPAAFGVAAMLAMLSLAGCAPMTPAQIEGVELRRFCESHPQEVAKCLGFLGRR